MSIEEYNIPITERQRFTRMYYCLNEILQSNKNLHIRNAGVKLVQYIVDNTSARFYLDHVPTPASEWHIYVKEVRTELGCSLRKGMDSSRNSVMHEIAWLEYSKDDLDFVIKTPLWHKISLVFNIGWTICVGWFLLNHLSQFA